MSSTYEGLVARFNRSNIKGGNESSAATQKKIASFMNEQKCPDCQENDSIHKYSRAKSRAIRLRTFGDASG